jgi:hypothetical protein
MRKAVEESLRKAKAAVTKVENKAIRDLKEQGVADRRAEKARLCHKHDSHDRLRSGRHASIRRY